MGLDELSALLIAIAVADWGITGVMIIASRRYPEPALQERAATSVVLSLIASIAAVLGAGRLGLLPLPNGMAVVLLGAALLMVSAPQFVWFFGLLMGKFK